MSRNDGEEVPFYLADNLQISTIWEDNLQKAAHKLNKIITEYGLTISVQKTKWKAFKGEIQ